MTGAEIDAALAKLADLDADAARAARAQVDSVTDEARLGSLLGRINAGISARINTKND